MFGLQPVYDAAGDKGAGAVALQQGNQLVYQRIEQLLMAIVAGQSLQHHGAGLRQVDLIDSLMHRASQQTLNARVIGQFEKTAHHLQQVLADPSGVLRLAEPVAEHQGWLIAADQRDQRRGIKELFLDKAAEVVGDAVFIARNNRRMAGDKGQRNTAKQSHDRKPVGQRPDHRRFGNSF
ncbi:Uncharacterised protein [Klebsiella pneumoniae]|nr:Uncharacterised protein [Klebsiella pneumoniae]